MEVADPAGGGVAEDGEDGGEEAGEEEEGDVDGEEEIFGVEEEVGEAAEVGDGVYGLVLLGGVDVETDGGVVAAGVGVEEGFPKVGPLGGEDAGLDGGGEGEEGEDVEAEVFGEGGEAVDAVGGGLGGWEWGVGGGGGGFGGPLSLLLNGRVEGKGEIHSSKVGGCEVCGFGKERGWCGGFLKRGIGGKNKEGGL